MTHLDMAVELACSPQQAWCLLTDPDQSNMWSTVSTRVSDTGSDDRFDRPGALREVRLPVPLRRRVHQVVTVADEPHRLDYMVYKGGEPVLRNHHCRIDIESTPAGCAVHLSVDMSFASKFGVFVAPSVRREWQKSLAGLSEHSKRLPPSTPLATPPISRCPDRRAIALLLRPEVERQVSHQQMMADEFARVGDPKYWFARAIVLVHQEMLALVDAHVFENPDWVLRLLSTLHRRYVSNLHAFRTGGPMSPIWRRAWERCEESAGGRPLRRLLVGTAAGAQAYMDEDLPTALADVYIAHYRDTRHYKEFRADFIRLGIVYGTVSDRMMAEMPAAATSRALRLVARLSPELRDIVLRARYFDFDASRMEAFDTGYDMACRDR